MINTNALRKKILELAFNGKLSSTIFKDNTAEELVKSITQQKEILLKEKKISKIKKLSEIKEDEMIFDIPEGWGYYKLGELCLPLSDGVHYAPEYQKNGYKCFSAKDIYNNQVNDNECTYVTEEEYLKMKEKINVQEGSILITKSGSIGRSAVVHEYFEFGLVESIGVINPIFVNPEYIKYVLDYGFVYSLYYYEKFTRGVGLKHLTLTLLENIPIPLPPLNEQNNLVKIIKETFILLDEIDTLQEKYSKNLSVLKEKIIDAGIRGKLTEQLSEDGDAETLYLQIQEEKAKLIKEGKIKKEKPLPEIDADEIPFEIPKKWKWVHFNGIGVSSLGKTLNKSTDRGDECRYLCSINVQWEGINLNTVKTARFDVGDREKYRLQRGDLLICEGGDSGRCAIWDSDEEMYYQNALHRVRFLGNINPTFYSYVMEAYKKGGIISNYTTGIGIQHLVQASLNSIWLPLPPVSEQERIVAKVESILEQINS